MPDINTPLPDAGHEALRQAIVAALADLASTGGDVDSSLEVSDVLYDLVMQHNTDIADLQARVTALEP